MSSPRACLRVLPAPGTLFDSPAALRLAIHESCLEYGYEVSVQHGGSAGGDIHCRVPTNGTVCSFALHYGRAGTKVKVTSTCETHTCSAKSRAERAGIARAWAESKIAGLEAELQLAPRKAASKGSSEELHVSDDGSDDESDEQPQQVQRRSAPSRAHVGYCESRQARSARSNTGDSTDCGDAESDGEESQPETHACPRNGTELTEKTVWPHASTLISDIDEMLERGQVSAPTPDDTFPTTRKLFTHLHAFANQNGHTVFRFQASKNGSWVRFKCTKGNERYGDSNRGCCPWFVEARRTSTGSYRLVQVMLEHNHALKSLDELEGESEAALDFASTSSSAPRAEPSSVQAASLFFDNQMRASPRSTDVQFSFTPLAKPAAPALHPALAFLADLKALISRLVPNLSPSSTSRFASRLVATGISSISDFANLLIFEIDCTLPHFLEGLAYREGGDVAHDAFLFLQLLRLYRTDSA